MDGGWFNIDHSGMIYTEDEQSKKIKYLKTISKTDSNKYTLYGNTQKNVFECVEGKECEMYGYYGNDEFNFIPYKPFGGLSPRDFIVNDFKASGYSDKIFINKYNKKTFGSTNLKAVTSEFNDIMVPAIEVSCGMCKDYTTNKVNSLGESMNRIIYLKESDKYSFGDVWTWVDMINNPENYKANKLENNPVKLNNF